MITVKSIANTFINWPVLHAAAAAAFGAVFIDANSTDNGASATVYLTQPVANQQATWDALVAAQDPVFLGLDRDQVLADGTDFVTVTVTATKPGAAPVTIQVTGPCGCTNTQLVTLTSGQGSVQIRTFLYGPQTITLVNPANRNGDTLNFTGV